MVKIFLLSLYQQKEIIMNTTAETTGLEKRFEEYKIEERFETLLEEHGTIQNVLKYINKDEFEMDELWGLFSSDCLGHGLTFCRLMRMFIKDRYDAE